MKILLLITFWANLSFGFAQSPSTDMSIDFAFMHDSGQKNLTDFRGQVVYLSFWASWCAPCINNFHKYKEIRDQLQERGVVLINVNIDKVESDYLNSVVKHPIQGINGYAGADPVLIEQYKLYSIPTYEIIQKNGYFYYLSDDPNRNIITEFEELLTEEN